MDNFKLGIMIRCIASGDLSGLEDIYNVMKDSIYAVIFMYIRNKQIAEDILQETILQIIDSSENFKIFNNPKAWIITIARNISVDYLRKQNRETELDENIADKKISLEYKITGKISALSMLEALPLDQREVVVLHVISGFKHKEISKILNIPLGTVCWRYNAAIKKLKQLYSEEEAV